jgi:energy-coupling factor transporter ATP-binding protein EcfA2
MRIHLPDKNFFLNKSLPERPTIKIVEHRGSGYNAHVFRAHSEDLGRDVACKIIPRKNLIGADADPPAWRAEVLKANRLRTSAVVKFSDITEWADSQNSIDCVVLISEFVEGPTLKEFIATRKRQIAVPFVIYFLKSMLEFFNDMVAQSIVHGDLHAGNVLVADNSAYRLMGDPFEFRITDFGVANATSEARLKDDFLQLALILKDLLEQVDYPSSSQRDKFTYNVLNDEFLARHLIEGDSTHDNVARQPKRLYGRLTELDIEFEKSQGQDVGQLVSPFDYLSCEQIGEAHSILRALYSEFFLGLPDIESRNNLVLTGPRGCGKTTVFKSLSLRHRIHTEQSDPAEVRYVGIYYRCDDLYFSFPRYKRPSRTEAVDLPVHFVTSTLLAELLTVLELWATRHFPDELKSEETRVSRQIWSALAIDPPREPGIDTFKAIASRLQRERQRAANKQRFVNDSKHDFGRYFGADVLVKACQELTRSFSMLRDRPFYFFVDDYSSPKITKELQENLNRLFMQRSSGVFFKLSTESPVSFAKADVDDKIYVEGREFSLLNLGLIYLHSKTPDKLQFIDDVFKRRLSAPPGFPANNLDDLIGSNPGFNNNEDARLIRQNKKSEHWGKETLSTLCSGDIHYLIGLVRDMVSAAGGVSAISNEIHPRVSRAAQNKAIRETAGNFLKSLRSVPRHGERLVEVVSAFGNVAHSCLRYKNSTNEKGQPPHQASRIEPYEPLNLSEEAKSIYDELLRYSVFIEDVRGKSRRGAIVPRLYLRRFLIPHFNLTFSLRDSIELEPQEFEEFLLAPSEFERKHRLKEAIQSDDPRLNFDTEIEKQ